ncbi:hypothetical protein NXY82_23380, partial [Escherichia coli]|nr:hypothetical protein [Escherichia coli]MCS0929615.1 hypothetical protein [Escherichia coli]
YLPRIGQVENMSVEGLFVHGGDLWRLNTPLSCLQPPQQGKTLFLTSNAGFHNVVMPNVAISQQEKGGIAF